ncbi:MAG TPA: ABC transporter permease subunit [Syntrophomonadaceae bacterium]|nr:ABC transporter permease subunit [Syntrophomonadaceae bacterium]
MNNLITATMNETKKILLKKKTVAIMLLSAFIPGLMAVIAAILQKRTGILVFGSADFTIWVLSFFTSIFLPLFVFMWSADSFSGEVEDGSLKVALLRPVTRFKVYLSKHGAIKICIIINLLVVLLFSELAGMFLSILGTGFLPGLGRGLAAYVLSVVPLMALMVMSAFVAQFFRSSSGALAMSILVYVGAQVLPIVSPMLGRLTPAAYTHWYLLWLTPSINWGLIIQALVIMLGGCLILFPAGYILFDRKDI